MLISLFLGKYRFDTTFERLGFYIEDNDYVDINYLEESDFDNNNYEGYDLDNLINFDGYTNNYVGTLSVKEAELMEI